MKTRIAAIAFLLASTAALSAAADPQLLNMVMPEAQMLAGVNVEQAKTTLFGQYVLSQVPGDDQHLQQMIALTGFDPRRDVRELLVASVGQNDPHTGLALARGVFDVAKIAAAAKNGGAAVSTYRGATVVTDPKGNGAFAFPDGTTVAAGKPALVQAALDRRATNIGAIPASLSTKAQQLSAAQDAWVVSLVPPSALGPVHAAPAGPAQGLQTAAQTVTQFSGGAKFGSLVVIGGEAQTLTAQDATSLAGVLQFLANMALAQSNGDPKVAALVKALTISATGQSVKLALTMPYDQFQTLLQVKHGPHPAARKQAHQ